VIGYLEGSIIAIYDIYPKEGESLDNVAQAQAQAFS